MSELPQTGDRVVDEVLETFVSTADQGLGERAAAAAQAQRRLQERLAESSPGTSAASGIQRVAGAPSAS